MCNLYTQTRSVDEVAQLFRDLQMPLSFPEGVPNLQAGEIAITDRAPIVRLATAGPGECALVSRRWSWPGPSGKPVYNFRSDGREFASGRCLILADGFYEFTAQADPKARRKHKWRFTLRGAPLFAIAGLWRSNPQVGEAFTMLTMPPGEDMAPYHNRQVAVVRPQTFSRWLDPAVPSTQLLEPLRAGSLIVEKVR